MAAPIDSFSNWAADVQSDDDLPSTKAAAPVEVASESESDEDGGDLLLAKKVKDQPAKKAIATSNKTLSKKEKEALKKKELEEMDDIFNEMGITLELAPAADTATSEASEAITDNDAKDKKKKKKAKTAGTKAQTAVAVAEAEVAPLNKEEIKARLQAKQTALAKKAPSLPDSVKEAMKEKRVKKKEYGSYDL